VVIHGAGRPDVLPGVGGRELAYLTISEVFPMETRALAIALFFAVGTATGGIVGPELFGQFVHCGNQDLIALGFFIGTAVMALGGVAELFLGVRAEQQSLERIAKPLTAEEAEADAAGQPPEPKLLPVEREDRTRERTDRIRRRERAGLRRFRPGPSGSFYSPGMIGTSGTTSRYAAMSDENLDREIGDLSRTLREHGPTGRQALAPS
jgi:MFS family permease